MRHDSQAPRVATVVQLPDYEKLEGTPSQVEWAERIRLSVDRDFDRVASAFQALTVRQTEQEQAETRAVIAILEEKRADTMKNCLAGYFIRNWQELSDQVRQMILQDARYTAIQIARRARHATCSQTNSPRIEGQDEQEITEAAQTPGSARERTRPGVRA